MGKMGIGILVGFTALSRLNANKYLNVDSNGNVITVTTFDNGTQEKYLIYVGNVPKGYHI